MPGNKKLSVPDSGFDQQFAFRAPTLRNLRFTAPYVRTGQSKSLLEVLEFCEDLSFGKSRNPAVPKERFDPIVQNIELSVKDMSSIILFFNTLNDTNFDRETPVTYQLEEAFTLWISRHAPRSRSLLLSAPAVA